MNIYVAFTIAVILIFGGAGLLAFCAVTLVKWLDRLMLKRRHDRKKLRRGAKKREVKPWQAK